MCAPKAPKMPELKAPEPLPPPPPLPTPQQAPPPPVMQAPQIQQAAPLAIPPMPAAPEIKMPAPPPVMANQGSAGQDVAIIKKRKSKRRELQQASSGTQSLRIPLSKSIGTASKGSTGSTGLNIPK